MNDLDDFLKHNIEGYLFGDLRAMQSIPVTYPLLMSTFAGVELLGELLYEKDAPKRSERGRAYFVEYWTEYLYPLSTSAIGNSLYTLVRNGIAHGFAPRGPIAVSREDPQRHLHRDASGVVIIDAVKLADDFIASYHHCVKPRVEAADGRTVSATFARMKEEYWGKKDIEGANFPHAPPSLPRPLSRAQMPLSQSIGATLSSTMAIADAGPPADSLLASRLKS